MANVTSGVKPRLFVPNSLFPHTGLLPYLCRQPPLGLLGLNRLLSLIILSTERKRNLQGAKCLIQEKLFESDQIALHGTSNFFCCLEKGYGEFDFHHVCGK